MANPKFLAIDLNAAYASITASAGSAAGYPTDNLYDYVEKHQWKAAAATTIDTLILGNHNFNGIMASGNLQYQHASDSGFTSALGTFNIDPTTDPWELEPSPVSRRYRRLYFNGALNWAPQLGNIFLASRFVMDYPAEFPIREKNPKFETTEKTSLSGIIRTAQMYGGRKTWELDFMNLPDATKANFLTWLGTARGKFRPFYYIDYSAAIFYVHLDADYLPVEYDRININNIKKFVMKEQAAG